MGAEYETFCGAFLGDRVAGDVAYDLLAAGNSLEEHFSGLTYWPQIMPPAISVPSVALFGANQVRAVGANVPAIPTSAYNANYLKPDPRSARTTPVAKPRGFKSVAGTFSASGAAKTGFVNEVAPSVYNANYLKTASPL